MRFALLVPLLLTASCASLFGQPNAHLLKDGVQAPAIVTALDQTGTFINRNPVCRITFTVTPKAGEPFSARVKQVVLLTQLAQLQPGTILTVRYDDKDHDRAIIEGLGTPPTMSVEEARVMALEGDALRAELNAPGAAIEATGIVERFENTGVLVDGPNPLAIMTVKVLPRAGAPYDATIRGVFAPSGIHKYQPGREIHVLLDPKDPQRVTVDTSKMHTLP